MKTVFCILIALLLVTGTIKSQKSDSSGIKPMPRHELGLSVLYPSLVILGGTPTGNTFYNNLCYRYRMTPGTSLRAFVGTTFPGSMNSVREGTVRVQPGNQKYLAYTEVQMPSNCQFGLGYEYLIGERKVKLLLGADFVYNNQFIKEIFYYTKANDSLKITPTRIDTGSYVKAENLNKFGTDLRLGMRYEMNRHWALTADCVISQRFYRRPTPLGLTSIYDFNIARLVSDVSLFYRF